MSDVINRRQAVANYLVQVKVSYWKAGGSPKSSAGPDDDVTLYTIVLD